MMDREALNHGGNGRERTLRPEDFPSAELSEDHDSASAYPAAPTINLRTEKNAVGV